MKALPTVFLALAAALSLPLSAQVIVPIQTDAIVTPDLGAPGKADPGDRIRYQVTIQNTGATPGTGVQLNVTPDVLTTFVPGSFLSTPVAVSDGIYSVSPNIQLTVPAASGVKGNDFDDNLAGATLSCGTCLSTSGGNVVLGNDGSFTYNPLPGYTGADAFTYTITDATIPPGCTVVPANVTATVNLNVSGPVIWFVQDGAAAGGDGRLNKPFNALTGAGSFDALAADDPGDYIFLYSGNYTGGLTLKATQSLIGQGASASLATITGISPPAGSGTLPTTGGTSPVITTTAAATSALTLGTGNTIRGLTIGNTTAADLMGTNFGTLTVSEVTLNGTGQTLNLTTGTLAATFANITSTGSPGAAGLLLSAVGGTLTVSGATSLTSAGLQGISIAGSSVAANFGSTTLASSTTQGILVGTSTGNISFGNTTITGGTDAVSLQNNSAGTRTFGTLSTTNNSGVGFLHAAGGGLTTFSGLATITNPGGRGIDIQNAAAANGVTFAAVNATQSGGTGVHLASNTGTVSFTTLDISPDAGQIGLFGLNNTGTITTTAGTISVAGNAAAVDITGASLSPLAMALTSVSSTGGANGIKLGNVSGSFNAGGGTLAGATTASFLITTGTAAITYSGSISTPAALAVDIDNHDSGNITFQTGNITSTTQGLRVRNCNGGTIAFNNPSKSLNTGINNAVELNTNPGATINFTNGNLVITTTTGTGFNAAGGGTVNVTGSGNTINSTSATALNVVNTTIGASNLNFLSISAGNNTVAADPVSGIILNTTGSSGGLTIVGSGGNGSGGTIQSITNRGAEFTSAAMISLSNMAFTNANLVDGGTCGAADNSGCNAAIYLNTVATVTLNNIDITGTTAQQGINAREVSNFQLLNSTINNAGNGGEEGGLYALNLSGTCAITGTDIAFPGGRSVTIYNTSRTLALDVTSSFFNDAQTSVNGADGFEVSSFGTSNTTLDFLNNSFLRNKTNGLQVITEDNSFTSMDMQGCTMDYGSFAGGGGGIDLDAADNGDVDFNIIGNPLFRGALTSIVNVFAAGNSTMEGRFNNNTVTLGIANAGDGIRVLAQESSDIKIEISGNTVSGITQDNGINAFSRAGDGRLDAVISGNNVMVGANANSNIRVGAGASGSTFTNKTCTWVKNNMVSLNGFSQWEGRVVNAHELLLQGTGGSMQANWNNNGNLPVSPPSIINPLVSGAGLISYNQTCNAPGNPPISF